MSGQRDLNIKMNYSRVAMLGFSNENYKLKKSHRQNITTIIWSFGCIHASKRGPSTKMNKIGLDNMKKCFKRK